MEETLNAKRVFLKCEIPLQLVRSILLKNRCRCSSSPRPSCADTDSHSWSTFPASRIGMLASSIVSHRGTANSSRCYSLLWDIWNEKKKTVIFGQWEWRSTLNALRLCLLLANIHLLRIVQFGAFGTLEGSTLAELTVNRTWHVAFCQFIRQQVDTPLLRRIQMEATLVIISSFECVVRFLHERYSADVNSLHGLFGDRRRTLRAAHFNQIFAICVQQEVFAANDESTIGGREFWGGTRPWQCWWDERVRFAKFQFARFVNDAIYAQAIRWSARWFHERNVVAEMERRYYIRKHESWNYLRSDHFRYCKWFIDPRSSHWRRWQPLRLRLNRNRSNRIDGSFAFYRTTVDLIRRLLFHDFVFRQNGLPYFGLDDAWRWLGGWRNNSYQFSHANFYQWLIRRDIAQWKRRWWCDFGPAW